MEINEKYFMFASGGNGSGFSSGIKAIESMPKFFEDSVNWGLDASYAALGFMCLMSLTVYLFKK